MDISEIKTPRIRLVPPTSDILRADEAKNEETLKRLLGVMNVPRGDDEAPLDRQWPPELFKSVLMNWTSQYPGQFSDGWGPWYICYGKFILVGVIWFKEPENGHVEISAEFLAQFHRNGYATEAVEALIRHAFQDSSVAGIIAKTTRSPAEECADEVRLLRKAGFECTHFDGSHWIWRKPRPLA